MITRDLIRVTQTFTFQSGWRPIPTNAFDVTVDGRHSWLKRLLFSCLKRLGCVKPHWDREMMITEKVLDPERVTALILREARVQFSAMYPGKTPVTVYVGMKDLSDLMSDPGLLRMGGFSFDGEDRHGKIHGLRIEAVRHMSGILIV